MERGRMEDIAEIFDFVHGGHAVFTLVSKETGNHITFKLERPKVKWAVNKASRKAKEKQYDEDLFRFIFLRGRNNDTWIYLGVITHKKVRATKASPQAAKYGEHKQFRIFNWFYRSLIHNPDSIFSHVEFYHEGHCGYCGKALTVPESIKRGIGPICIKYGPLYTKHLKRTD